MELRAYGIVGWICDAESEQKSSIALDTLSELPPVDVSLL